MVSLPPDQAMAKTFAFLNLPRELRDIVYTYLIQAGHLSILRASKPLSKEALAIMPRVATHRIDLGSWNLSRASISLTNTMRLHRLRLTAPYYIQNLDIRFDLVRRKGTQAEWGLIRSFSGDQIARRSCNITILFGVLGPLFRRPDFKGPEEDAACKVIASLTGFKTLTLKLEYRKNERREAEILRFLGQLSETTDPDDKLLKDYKEISGFLAKSLGPAKLNDGLDGPYLLFKPGTNKTLDQASLRTRSNSSNGDRLQDRLLKFAFEVL